MDDFPAIGEFLEHQAKDAADIPSVPREMPFAEDQRSIATKRMNLKIAELQMAHRGVIWVALLVMSQDRGIATRDTARTGQGKLRGIPVTLHESLHISLIPGSLLAR